MEQLEVLQPAKVRYHVQGFELNSLVEAYNKKELYALNDRAEVHIVGITLIDKSGHQRLGLNGVRNVDEPNYDEYIVELEIIP